MKTESTIFDLLRELRESSTVELKASHKELPKEFWPSYSAFCNTDGGVIFLGVKESQPYNEIVGVINPDKIMKVLWDQLSNQQKVSFNALSNDSIRVLTQGDKSILMIDIPEVSYLHKPVFLNGNYSNAYIRSGDGDRKITDAQLRAFIRNATPNSSSDILLDAKLSDLDPVTIALFKETVTSRNPHIIDPEMTQENFLLRIGAITKDDSNVSRIKKGTLLFLGKYQSIRKFFPNYFLDFQNRSSSESRWIDRVATDELSEIEMNVYNFFTSVSAKMKNQLNQAFDLDENQVRTTTADFDTVVREAFTNCLAHADYELASPSIKIVMHNGWITFTNPGQMLITKGQFFRGGQSIPRNELIMTFFRYIGASERQGGGGPQIYETTTRHSFRMPELKTCIDYTELTIWYIDLVDSYPELSNDEKAVFSYIVKSRVQVSTRELQSRLGFTEYKVRNILAKLVNEGKIEKIGNGKSTRYRVVLGSDEWLTSARIFLSSL